MTSTTASGHRGTTCSSSCAARWSTTSPSRSPSGGRTRRPSTPAPRSGRRCTAGRSTRSSPGRVAPSVRPPADGPLAVQVLRTYPELRDGYPFADCGERSIARAYLKAFSRAQRLVYLEDQYLWSVDATRALCEALVRSPELQIVVVVPRYPDPDGALSGQASRIGRERVLDVLHDVGHHRVAVYDLENVDGDAIYVHSKVCVIDDVWMAVGSDNLNRRSWTHDSELSCAVVDGRLDERAPRDPAGLGDGARVLARDTRIRLAAEHLGRAPDDVDDLVDPTSWFEALRRGAGVLDALAPRWRPGPAPGGTPAGAPVRAGAGRPAVGARPGARGVPRSRRAPARAAGARRVLSEGIGQARSASSSARAGRGSGPTRMPRMPRASAAVMLPAKSSRNTVRGGSLTPSRSNAVR